jgi:hypothetical protein
MKRYPGLLAAGFLLLFVVHPAFAQTDRECQVLKRQIESLKPEQAVIKKDLHEIRLFAQASRRPPTTAGTSQQVIVDVRGAPTKGDKSAKIVLVEFSDYQ